MTQVLFLALVGCADDAPQSGLLADEKVVNGSAALEAHHDATVALHEASSRGVSVSPFCTGTLIDPEWVLTAAHCLEGFRGDDIVVYFGDDPSQGLAGSALYADGAVSHPSYDSFRTINDIALVHLSAPVQAFPSVPVLPGSLGLSAADEGGLVNFAGFGYSERGYGEKLQIDGTIGQVGNTQVSYGQRSGGPCNGDSGGPMFIQRGGVWHVAGVTSYGDQACTQYGVSTRVDAYESWINAYVAPANVGTGAEPTTDPVTPLAITNESASVSGTSFTITWTTSAPANTVVDFETYGANGSDDLVTEHSLQFNGDVGDSYRFEIQSTDAQGNTAASGPWAIEI